MSFRSKHYTYKLRKETEVPYQIQVTRFPKSLDYHITKK